MLLMPQAGPRDVRRMEIRVDQIDLDPENPRLIVPPNASQVELATQLYEQEGLDELVPSFQENGYFAEEPLVVVRIGAIQNGRRQSPARDAETATR